MPVASPPVRVVLFLLLAVLLVPAGVAFHDDDLPVLVPPQSGDFEWVAVKVATNGAPIALDLVAHDVSTPQMLALYAVGPDGVALYGFPAYSSDAQTGANVRLGPLGSDVREHASASIPTSSVGVSLNTDDDPRPAGTSRVGTYTLIAMVHAQQSSTDWTIRALPGAEVLSVTTGKGAMALGSGEFDGGVHAQAYAGNMGGRATIASEKTLVVEGRFFGFFGPFFPTSQDVLSVDGPQGSQSCPCAFTDAVGARSIGPGSFTFRATGAGASIHPLDDFILIGADVLLPP